MIRTKTTVLRYCVRIVVKLIFMNPYANPSAWSVLLASIAVQNVALSHMRKCNK